MNKMSFIRHLSIVTSASLLLGVFFPQSIVADHSDVSYPADNIRDRNVDDFDMRDMCAGAARVFRDYYFVVDKEEDSLIMGNVKSKPGMNRESSSVENEEMLYPVSVIEISSVSDMESLAKNAGIETYTKGKTFILTNNIDLGTCPGLSVPAFFGTFDGKGHSISGVSFDEEGYSSGLFRYVKQGAVIRNLAVNANITVSDDSLITGGICGINEGIISDCVFDGEIKGRNITGGIAAINEVAGTIMACKNKAAITGFYFTGGICGKNYGVTAYSSNEGNVNNTTEWVEESDEQNPGADKMSALLSGGLHIGSEETFGKMKGRDTGGIAGYSTGALVRSVNEGEIGYEHTGYNVGGIAGRQAGLISGCENHGGVYGRKDIGGIVGQMEPYLTIDDLESLPDAVDKLHDLVQKSLDDAHSTSDIISDDMKRLSDLANDTVDLTDALADTGKVYIDGLSDSADSLQARVDYLTDAVPDIFDDLDDATDDFAKTAKTIKRSLKDANILDRLSDEDEAALDRAIEELKDRDIKNLPDRFDAIKETLSIIIPEAKDASRDTRKNIKKLYKRLDELSDSLHDTVDHASDVFDHLNEMPKPTVPRLGVEFDLEREALRSNLDAITDTLSAFADHSDASSDLVTADMQDVNDQVNVVFHIISDELDRIGDITRGEDDALIKDVSEEEIEAVGQGKVEECHNSGTVKGDIDIGGISGAMYIDSEDPEENAAGTMDGGFSDKYLLRNVVQSCENDAMIESKKDGVGGIVGYMGHGIVAGCSSYGAVTSKEGSYAGGIAGQSFSIIKSSNAMTYLDAASYVGGIAGFGTTITGCRAIPFFEGRNNRTGSIAGQVDADKDTHMQHLEVITDNTYVNEDIAGIDYFSMTGIAEPVTYRDMVSANSSADGFSKVVVTFITRDEEDDETEVIGIVRLPYGTPLSEIVFPEVQVEDEEYVRWPDFDDGEVLRAPLPVKGFISDVQKTLTSDERYPGTQQAAVLAAGRFTKEDVLLAGITVLDEDSIEYTVEYEGNGNEIESLRFYNPFEKYEMYGMDENGNGQKLDSEGKGSYAEYRGEQGHYDRFLIKNTKRFSLSRFFSKDQ